MSSPNEAQRDLKRPYRKKAFQTGYTQSGEAVAAYPPLHLHMEPLSEREQRLSVLVRILLLLIDKLDLLSSMQTDQNY